VLKSTFGIHSVGNYNAVADNTGLSSFV